MVLETCQQSTSLQAHIPSFCEVINGADLLSSATTGNSERISTLCCLATKLVIHLQSQLGKRDPSPRAWGRTHCYIRLQLGTGL